jgi:hypothetical protein
VDSPVAGEAIADFLMGQALSIVGNVQEGKSSVTDPAAHCETRLQLLRMAAVSVSRVPHGSHMVRRLLSMLPEYSEAPMLEGGSWLSLLKTPLSERPDAWDQKKSLAAFHLLTDIVFEAKADILQDSLPKLLLSACAAHLKPHAPWPVAHSGIKMITNLVHALGVCQAKNHAMRQKAITFYQTVRKEESVPTLLEVSKILLAAVDILGEFVGDLRSTLATNLITTAVATPHVMLVRTSFTMFSALVVRLDAHNMNKIASLLHAAVKERDDIFANAVLQFILNAVSEKDTVSCTLTPEAYEIAARIALSLLPAQNVMQFCQGMAILKALFKEKGVLTIEHLRSMKQVWRMSANQQIARVAFMSLLKGLTLQFSCEDTLWFMEEVCLAFQAELPQSNQLFVAIISVYAVFVSLGVQDARTNAVRFLKQYDVPCATALQSVFMSEHASFYTAGMGLKEAGHLSFLDAFCEEISRSFPEKSSFELFLNACIRLIRKGIDEWRLPLLQFLCTLTRLCPYDWSEAQFKVVSTMVIDNGYVYSKEIQNTSLDMLFALAPLYPHDISSEIFGFIRKPPARRRLGTRSRPESSSGVSSFPGVGSDDEEYAVRSILAHILIFVLKLEGDDSDDVDFQPEISVGSVEADVMGADDVEDANESEEEEAAAAESAAQLESETQVAEEVKPSAPDDEADYYATTNDGDEMDRYMNSAVTEDETTFGGVEAEAETEGNQDSHAGEEEEEEEAIAPQETVATPSEDDRCPSPEAEGEQPPTAVSTPTQSMERDMSLPPVEPIPSFEETPVPPENDELAEETR